MNRFARRVAADATGQQRVRPGGPVGLVAVVLVVGLFAPVVARAQTTEADVLSILADMAVQQHHFKPDRLHIMGLAGLAAVLDELLPDTAEPKKLEVSADSMAQFVEQLGSSSLRTREAATEKLFRLGPGARLWVVAATRHADAEVGWRAARILRGWEARKWEDKSKYLPAFTAYATGIRDEPRLQELLRRTKTALDVGMPENGRYAVLNLCIRVIASAGNDQYSDALKPMLKHADVQVAVLVTQSVGEATVSTPETKHFPSLLLEALQSGREEVVAAAIGWTEHSADGPRRTEVERLLIAVFEGSNEQLKFQACSPLMHAYHNAAARDYLLQQAQQADLNRRYMALSWLCCTRHPGSAPDKKLLETLQPLLKNTKDPHTRYMAAIALASYSGEEVVKSLIPLLADPYNSIPNEVSVKLLEQSDKAMLRRLLGAAAKDASQTEKVRQQAAAVLEQLDRNERSS